MAVPGSGNQKTLGKIRKELHATSTSNDYNDGPKTSPATYLKKASNGTHATINVHSTSQPNGTGAHGMNEFSGYSHLQQAPGGGCFAGGQKVETKARGIINIEDLEIGEFVKTQKGWSKLYCWNMYTKNTSMEFLVLHHTQGKLLLSDLHYIYVNNKRIAAKDIKVGDTIVYKGNPVLVINITRKQSIGIFCPHTINGKILVNNIECSVYTHLNPLLQHILSKFIRVMFFFFPKEANDKYYNMTPVDSKSTQLLQGMHKWVYICGNFFGVTDKAKINNQLTIEELKNE